ncbi:MAG: RIP metalloprotease RseP [Anaerovorax sp.]
MIIVYAILIFCLLIFVHEFGHFISAKAVGIRVNEFSIGMGPLLFHFNKGETEYSLRALPIGGYCKMEGEDEDSEDPKAFNNQSFWAKALVIVAGSVMNVVLAIVIVSCVVFAVGTPTNVIKELTPNSPAAMAGVQPGDEILKIDNEKITKWQDITEAISEGTGETVTITVNRNGKELSIISGVTTLKEENNRRVVGIVPKQEKNLVNSVVLGAQGTWNMGVGMIQTIGQLFTGKVALDALTGPVGIVSIVGDSVALGFIYVAQLAALISLNLGIVNLLPLPALDGGRLVFLVIRKFTGKAISDELEGKIHFVGILLLFSLMIYITFIDVGRFIL